jgi:hypothetical protein
MTLNLTTLNSRTSITNNPPPAAPACGLNETGICCKESETAHGGGTWRVIPLSPEESSSDPNCSCPPPDRTANLGRMATNTSPS